MKIKLEEIMIAPGRSFKLFSPSLRHHFYWHFHPEIELVYVEALSGIRHVGQHISSYVTSDLVLIGPNVPHLNFDYGLEVDYKQIVLQLKPDFLPSLVTPTAEFAAIATLMEQSYKGLSFHGRTKEAVVTRLRDLQEKDAFSSLLGVLDIFQILAHSGEVEVLNPDDTTVKWLLNDKVRMGTIYDYVSENYDKDPDVNVVAEKVHLSTAAFCRYFKRQTNMTFTDFLNQYRISQAKNLLLQGKSAAEVCYEVGFESTSYFNKLFKTLVGQTPALFKRMHQHQ
ncbi:AraC family transcriptional regulator [Chitinophaga pinensis]|uniref:Transcriptional regulator, AraC family n=1 Tax=Chitinophaga pinensis (strain ATCC 43595 / DSM 2588 / LMG 13176 / NBRC 15968 / NCIMB 11800 / UQM 2034) TaxID=485918 RepID=A0A979G6K8_CHIPD|nr:AraC family transcriptional regulator [Chitinophaga pinensis]ACU61824.1 transcriptional regulator, AraC family [Chitinophaga pinensis DSM 2588]